MKRDYNNTDWNLIDSNFIIHYKRLIHCWIVLQNLTKS